MVLAPMGKFYGKLPGELLDLTIEDFRLAYQCWRMYEEERVRQLEDAQHKAEAEYQASRMG